MHGVPQHFDNPRDCAQFRILAHRPGVELYRAHIVHHAFAPHTHDAYGFGAIAHGVERFRYRGGDHLAPPDAVVTMQPDVLHTGQAETADGWGYQMIYIEPWLLAELSGEPGWWFAQAVDLASPARGRRLSWLLGQLWVADEPLACDGLLAQLADELRPLARAPHPATASRPHRFAPVLDYMHAHLAERIRLEELAAVAGLSPFHFQRQFRLQYHVTPQQMLMARRLYAAKQQLAAGVAPAMVAAACGLADQAHLTRAFTQRYGVTPARYQRQVRT